MLRPRSRFRRAAIQLLCVLLLATQYVSVAHAIWHAAKMLPDHQERSLDRPDEPGLPELSKLCAFDAAFGQLLGAAPPVSRLCVSLPHTGQSFFHPHHDRAPLEALVPLSRGPPALL
jgi:hypothetical protein